MSQDEMEFRKRAIKRTYKRYIGERTDEKATILDVAKFFNIPIDESRIDDFVVNSIDCTTPSIEITDLKNSISYTATYTGNADLLNYSGPTQFNKVVSISPLRKEEILYYIGSNYPIITKMTFTNGEYDLVFEREINNFVGIFSNDGVMMTIRYLQNLIYNGRSVKQPLFNKIYRGNPNKEDYVDVFEQTYTYSPCSFIACDNTQDKYSFIKNNNVIYGINKFEQKGCCHYLRGICYESTDVPTSNYFPMNMHAENYPLLNQTNLYSAMIFKFRTEDGIHHSLQVYKTKDAISIIYHSEKHHHDGRYRNENIADEKYTLPSLSDGTISSEEIQRVITSLKSILKDAALYITSNELNAFATKIDIKNGISKEKLDSLSPKKFVDKSFDDICDLISQNKDAYFELIKGQFETAINANGDQRKEHLKQLKPSSEN